MKKILIPFLLFFIICGFAIASFPSAADDQNGTFPRSPSIAWDSCSISGPLNVGGSSNTSLLFGDPAVVYLDNGASSGTYGTQYEYVFRNPSWYHDYSLIYSNYLHSSTIETKLSFNTIQSSSQTTTITYSCADLVLNGLQFFDYLNGLYFTLVPTGEISSVSCSYNLSFKCNRVYPTFFSCDDFIDADNPWALVKLAHPSSQSYSFSGFRSNASNLAFFPITDYSANEFKNFINGLDNSRYIDLRSGASEQSFYELHGLSDNIAFSDLVLSFTFNTSLATALSFTITQPFVDPVGLLPFYGTKGFDQYSQYFGDPDSSLDFTSVVKATGAFFDLKIGPSNLTLGMLGMFGLGMVLIIILIKCFKGG